MTKIKRFLMYLMTYIGITCLTAFSVVLITRPTGANTVDVGGDSSQTVTSPITYVIENFSTHDAINFDINLNVNSNNNNILVNGLVTLDLTNGLENIACAGSLTLTLQEKQIDVDLTYVNGELYVSLLNGNYLIETNNLITSLNQILNLLNIEMPEIGIDLENLDMMSLMSLFDGVKEIKTDTNTTLTLSLPMVGDVVIVCDLNYAIQNVMIPNIEVNNTNINLSIFATYPENVKIEKPSVEAINVTHVLNLLEGMLKFVNNNKIGLEINLNYNNQNFKGVLSCDLENFNAKFDTNILGKNLSIIAINNVIYAEYENLFVKFDLNNLEQLSNLLSSQFGINVPIKEIANILVGISNNKSNLKALDLNNFNLSNFDLNKIDLSILESFNYENGIYTLSIKNVGELTFGFENHEFKNITFNGFEISANINAYAPQNIELKKDENVYADLNKTLPTINAILNTSKLKHHYGSLELKLNNTNLVINYEVNIQNGLQAKFETLIYNIPVKAVITNNKIYLTISNTNIVCDFKDFEQIKQFVLTNFNLNMPDVNTEQIVDIINKVFGSENLLISNLESFNNGLTFNVLSNTKVTIKHNETINFVEINTNNANVILNIESNNELGNYNIDTTKFVETSNILSALNNVLNYVKNGTYYVNVELNYKNLNIVGFINYENNSTDYLNNLQAQFETNILGKNIVVKLLNKTIYAEVDGLNVKFELNDINKILDFVKKNFDVNTEDFNNVNNLFDDVDFEELLKNLTFTLTNNNFEINNNNLNLNFNFENKNLMVNFNDLQILATINNTKQNIKLENNYINLTTLLPFAQSLLNTINQGKLEGSVYLIINNQALTINYKVQFKENIQIWLQTKIKGLNVKINYVNNNILISIDNLNFKANASNLTEIINFINNTFNTELNVDLSNLITKENLENILNSISLGMIKNVVATKNALQLNINNIEIGLLFNNYINELTVRFNNIYVNAKIVNLGKDVVMPNININAYENISTLINIIETNYNNLSSKQLTLCGTISLNSTNLPVNAEINFSDGINIKLSTAILEKNIELVLSNETIYANIDGLKAFYNLKDIPSLLELIKQNFNIDISKELNNTNVNEIVKTLYISSINKIKNENGVSIEIKLSVLNNTIFANLNFNNANELNNVYVKINDNIVLDFNLNLGAQTNINVNTNEYETNLNDLTSLINPINNLINGNKIEINGEIKFSLFNELQPLTINNLQVDYSNINNINLFANVDFYGLNINVGLIENTIYAGIDDLKVYVELSEIPELINWINSTFNTNINLKESKNFDFNKITDMLKNVCLGENIKRIYKTPNGLMIELFDYVNENFVSNNQEIVLTYNNNLSNIIINYNKLNANINFTKFNDDVNLPVISHNDYVHYSTFKNIITNAYNYITSKQYSFNANAQVYNGNTLTYNANVNLDVDVKNNLMLNGNAKLTGQQNVEFDLNYYNKYLFVNYNNLKLKICENDLKELMVIILNLIGVDPSIIPFLQDVANDLDNINFDSITNLIPSIDFGNPLSALTIIKNISFENNELVISLDGSKISNNPNAKEMALKITTENEQLKAISLNNIFTGVTENEYFNLNININNFNGVNAPEDLGYIDLSGANELIKAIINTAELNYYEINGSLNINGDLIGIDINWNVPLNIKVKLDELRKPEILATIGAIPVVPAVNDDAPYKFGNTVSGIYAGLNRMLTVYYKDGFAYFYRKEEVPVFASSNRIYEKKLKVSAQELLANPLDYLQYGVGFTDDIMNAIRASLELSKGHTPNLGNVINSFVVNNSTYFTVELNMQEITNDPKMGTMTVGLGVVNNESTNNKNYVGNATFNMFMPLADAFQLTLDSNDLTLVNIGKELNFDSMYNYINSYAYNEGAKWEAYDGSWTLASETKYTINFEENGGEEVGNIVQAPGTQIVIPTYSSNKVVNDVNNHTKYVYTFDGWYTSPTFEPETKFVSNTMPRKDINLYAKWNLTQTIVTNFYTITFNTNGGNESYESISVAENSDVNLSSYIPTKNTYYVDKGYNWFGSHAGKWTYEVTRYTFAGWFTDANCTIPFNGTMPSKNITLFAKWNANTTTEYYYNWERP